MLIAILTHIYKDRKTGILYISAACILQVIYILESLWK